MAKFAHNNRQCSSIGKSPFIVNLRRHPNIYRGDKKSTQKVLEEDEFVQQIREVRREVEEALKKTNKVMKRKTDKTRGEVIGYKGGDSPNNRRPH